MDDLKKEKKDSAGSTAYGQVENKAEVKKYPDSIVNIATSQLDAYYRYTAKQYGFGNALRKNLCTSPLCQGLSLWESWRISA